MENSLLVHVRVYRERFFEEHFYGADHIFALVCAGSFAVERGDERFIIKEGEGMVFQKNVSYFRKVLSPVTMHLFRYASEKPLFRQEHIRFADIARIRSTIRALDNAENKMGKEHFQYETHLFTDLIFQHWAESTSPLHQHDKKDHCICQAISEIHESIDRKISLPRIASQCGLSYAHFFRRFQAYTGRTPSEYIAFCRLQKAKSLLHDPALSIKNIAFACGFENEYYFSNFFKKQMGVSPTIFRNSLL
ncbi:MAG: helix-turn-helix transcriptional regulator [Clostridia bacterium]|nr:helix-turn-helix transcriptional regulator [Clostridia bacterium]